MEDWIVAFFIFHYFIADHSCESPNSNMSDEVSQSVKESEANRILDEGPYTFFPTTDAHVQFYEGNSFLGDFLQVDGEWYFESELDEEQLQVESWSREVFDFLHHLNTVPKN